MPPKTNVSKAIVVKRDGGGETSAMAQPQTQSFLLNVLGNNSGRESNLKQALNALFDGDGKATGSHRFENAAVLHTSAGNGITSITLFYVMAGDKARIFAMGEHAGPKSYRVSIFGQRGTDFQEGRIIAL